jgi:hypothetical protein
MNIKKNPQTQLSAPVPAENKRRHFLFASLAALGAILAGLFRPRSLAAASKKGAPAEKSKTTEFNMDPVELFSKKLETYRRIADKDGEKKAWATLYDGYPERQRKLLGSFLKEGETLAQSFAKGIPMYKKNGMDMAVVDISNSGRDAVLEIQRVCLILKHELHKKYDVKDPCRVICQMDIDATEEAFADVDMKGRILSAQAKGDCLCIFKYERKPVS